MKTVKNKLSQILSNRNMTQKELAQLAGLREAQVSSISRNAGDKINYDHLGKIMTVLKITDFNEILELTD